MEAKTITLKTLAVSTAAVLIAEMFLRPAVSALSVSALPGIAITRITEITALMLIAHIFENGSHAIGLAPDRMLSGFIRGLIWSGIFGVSALILMLLLHAAGINILRMLHTPLPSSPVPAAIYFAVGGIIGPLAEEIFFRGILYGYFRRWGVYPAVIMSTVCFVLPHMSTGLLPITQIVGGLVFAIAYEKEKSLMAPITIHCLGNLAIFSIGLLS